MCAGTMAEDDFFLAIRQFQSAAFDGSKNREVAILKSALCPWMDVKQPDYGTHVVTSEHLPLHVPCDNASWNGSSSGRVVGENFCYGSEPMKRVRLDAIYHHQLVDTLDCMESFPATSADGNHVSNQSLMVISDDDDESLTDQGLATSSSAKVQKMPFVHMVENSAQDIMDEPSRLHVKGEHRLRIQFIALGTIGEVPQRFGKTRCGIPDGLCGTTHVYDQHWKFRVSHVVTSTGVRIKWRIESLASGLVSEVIESDNDSRIRCRSGRTICNIVLKKAFDMRAQELKKELETVEKDSCKYGKIQNLIQALHPTRCTVGLLFFGLLHECVQQKWEAEMRSLEA